MRRPRVYIATKLENAIQHRRLRDLLALRGVAVTYDWTIHGSVQHDTQRLEEVSVAEVAGVREADAVVVLFPGGRGTHTELGVALGLRIPIIAWSPERLLVQPGDATSAFYHHPGIKTWKFGTAMEDLARVVAEEVSPAEGSRNLPSRAALAAEFSVKEGA